jgi:hypothetical protein
MAATTEQFKPKNDHILMHYVLAAFAEQQNQSKTPVIGQCLAHEKIDGFHTLHRIIRRRILIPSWFLPSVQTPSHPLGVVDRRNPKLRRSIITFAAKQDAMSDYGPGRPPTMNIVPRPTILPPRLPLRTNLRPPKMKFLPGRRTSRSRRWTTSFKDEASWIRFKGTLHYHH